MKAQAKRGGVFVAFGILQATAAQHIDVGRSCQVPLQKRIQAEATARHAFWIIRQVRWQRLLRREIGLFVFIEQPYPPRLQPQQPGNVDKHFLQRFMHIDFTVQMARDDRQDGHIAV